MPWSVLVCLCLSCSALICSGLPCQHWSALVFLGLTVESLILIIYLTALWVRPCWKVEIEEFTKISQCLFSHKKSSPYVLQSFGCLYISLQNNQISVEHQWRNIFSKLTTSNLFFHNFSPVQCLTFLAPTVQHQTDCNTRLSAPSS